MREILHAADFGDVPTWGALIFAVVAVVVGFQAYRIEHRREGQAEDDRRARAAEDRQTQASLVCAWFGSHEGSVGRLP